MQRPKTWALVADGVRARILRGLEDGAARAGPESELVSRSRSQHLREMMRLHPAPPARSGGRARMGPATDPIRRDMHDFARDLLDRLASHRRAGDFEHLALFAAPAMLGILREEMPRALRGAVILERSQNLVQLPAAELRDIVRREIRVPGTDMSA